MAKLVAQAFDKELPSLTTKVTDACTGSLQAICSQAWQPTVQSLTGCMEVLGEGQATLKKGQEKLSAQVEELSDKLTAAIAQLSGSSSTPDLAGNSQGIHSATVAGGSPGMVPDVTAAGFFRKPDPTKLYCNVHDMVQVSRVSFHAAVVALAAEVGITDDHFDLVGEPLDNRFEIQFTGPSAPARALQFYQSLQLGRGKWKPQNVTDDLDEQHQFYVQPDKNGAQIRREVLSKGLKEIVQSAVPGKQFFVRKSTGSVMVDRRVLCTAFITGEQSARIAWVHPKRIQLQLDEAEIGTQFAAIVGGPSYS